MHRRGSAKAQPSTAKHSVWRTALGGTSKAAGRTMGGQLGHWAVVVAEWAGGRWVGGACMPEQHWTMLSAAALFCLACGQHSPPRGFISAYMYLRAEAGCGQPLAQSTLCKASRMRLHTGKAPGAGSSVLTRGLGRRLGPPKLPGGALSGCSAASRVDLLARCLMPQWTTAQC